MMDMAHVSGLVAAQVLNNPFEYCDLVSTTTSVSDYLSSLYHPILNSFVFYL
jgi:hypothetical protein